MLRKERRESWRECLSHNRELSTSARLSKVGKEGYHVSMAQQSSVCMRTRAGKDKVCSPDTRPQIACIDALFLGPAGVKHIRQPCAKELRDKAREKTKPSHATGNGCLVLRTSLLDLIVKPLLPVTAVHIRSNPSCSLCAISSGNTLVARLNGRCLNSMSVHGEASPCPIVGDDGHGDIVESDRRKHPVPVIRSLVRALVQLRRTAFVP